MKTAILQNCIDRSCIRVFQHDRGQGKGRPRIHVWVDINGNYIAHCGNEAPFYMPLFIDGQAVTRQREEPEHRIGTLSKSMR